MDPSTFEAFNTSLYASVVAATRSLTSLTDDYETASRVDEQTTILLNRILKVCGGRVHMSRNTELKEQWPQIVDTLDGLFERVDSCLDEFKGFTKKTQNQINNIHGGSKRLLPLDKSVFRADIPKPQDKFKIRVKNSNEPFIPHLSEKENAIVPFNLKLIDEEKQIYENPYAEEISKSQYPFAILQQEDPIPFLPFPTPPIWVRTVEDLQQMLSELEKADEIAVDLEHHDYRSFGGLVCLMQISTRQSDWLVDTLELREELHILNKVFTNPKIIKVLHGAIYDIQWLQRDFGIYVVSLFDTFHAARILEERGQGLAYLLKKYTDFDADKRYQRADWRVRPLPTDMENYAQSDTHFLLYIFDHLRNQLLNMHGSKTDPFAQMTMVLNESRKFAIQSFHKNIYDESEGTGVDGWRGLLNSRSNNGLISTKRKLSCFKALHSWRNKIAREEDESITYVLTNEQLFSLATLHPESTNTNIIEKVANGPLARHKSADILRIILDSSAAPDEEIAPQIVLPESNARFNVAEGEARKEPPPLRQSGRHSQYHNDSKYSFDSDSMHTKSSILFGDIILGDSEELMSEKGNADALYRTLNFDLPMPALYETPVISSTPTLSSGNDTNLEISSKDAHRDVVERDSEIDSKMDGHIEENPSYIKIDKNETSQISEQDDSKLVEDDADLESEIEAEKSITTTNTNGSHQSKKKGLRKTIAKLKQKIGRNGNDKVINEDTLSEQLGFGSSNTVTEGDGTTGKKKTKRNKRKKGSLNEDTESNISKSNLAKSLAAVNEAYASRETDKGNIMSTTEEVPLQRSKKRKKGLLSGAGKMQTFFDGKRE